MVSIHGFWRVSAMAILAFLVLCAAGVAVAAETAAVVKLPDPQTSGGPGIFDMLENRSSAPGGSFPTGAILMEELSTLLWSASGMNRSGRGWIVPMAMGREPYCKVYVTGEEGTFLYDWKTHSLIETSKKDARKDVGAQSFAATAPYILIFTTDGKGLGGSRDVRRAEDWAQVLVGAMTQDVYLAAEALGIGTRYMANLDADAVRSVCALAEKDVPVCIMPIGKR